MPQFIYSMLRVSKTVPPKRTILKDISLSFFPGAKIGVLGLNGAGKSTLIRIMAGVDKDFEGEARPQPGIRIGYLPQEPVLDPEKTVREVIEESFADVIKALKRLDEVYAAYAEDNADFDALSKEQAELEALIDACFWKRLTCCFWTNRRTTWTPSPSNGWSSSSTSTRAPWWP